MSTNSTILARPVASKPAPVLATSALPSGLSREVARQRLATVGRDAWQIGRLTVVGIFMGLCLLAFCVAVVAVGQHRLHARIDTLRTLAVIALVFGGEATMYAVRGRGDFWGPHPSRWVVLSSIGDVLIVSILAWCGILMTPVSAAVLGAMLIATVAFAAVLNGIKMPVFRRLQIA